MSNLPSRTLPKNRHRVYTEEEVKEIVESWRSGRLIDSEAIDKQAVMDWLSKYTHPTVTRWADLPAESAEAIVEDAYELIAALIGDTNE